MIALSAGQLLCATVLLALFTPFASAPGSGIGLDGLGSILALGILGTGIAYVLNYGDHPCRGGDRRVDRDLS